MGNQNIEGITLGLESSIQELLEALGRRIFGNKQSGFVIVVNTSFELMGVVTDADIRKYLSKHRTLPTTIEQVMRTDFISVTQQEDKELMLQEISKLLSQRGWITNIPIRFVPITNGQKVPVSVIDLYDFHSYLSRFRDDVVIVGLGYVGLTILAALANASRRIIGIDNDNQKVNALKSGKALIHEKGVQEAINTRLNKNLQIQNDLSLIDRVDGKSSVFVICLPTPLHHFNKTLNLQILWNFVEELIPVLRQGDTLVMRSTVPVGTGRKIIEKVQAIKNWIVGSDFYFVSAPERTVEGNALQEIGDLPQILGGATEACVEKGTELFQKISRFLVPVSSIEVSETIKIAGNAYRDYSFAFSNYLAMFCSEFNIDVTEVIKKSNLGYSRSLIPLSSPGVGGPCLTKDPYLFHSIDGVESPIIAARKLNEITPQFIVNSILKYISRKNSAICIGLAFKGEPATDDLRNSTSLEIAKNLESYFETVYQWDAVIDSQTLRNGVRNSDLKKINGVDLVAILNNHVDNQIVAKNLITNSEVSDLFVFDPWNLLDFEWLNEKSAGRSITYMNMSVRKRILDGFVQ